MAFADASLTALRVFREVAERGTLTAAAAALGYTQSAVSRQIAALERAAGTPLLERRHDGVRLTAGRARSWCAAPPPCSTRSTPPRASWPACPTSTARSGSAGSPAPGAALLPRALAALRRTHPAITVITREGSTPALVRALRAGTLDLALLASAPPFRPPDAETPRAGSCRRSPNAACAWPCPRPTRSRAATSSTSPTCAASAGSRARATTG